LFRHWIWHLAIVSKISKYGHFFSFKNEYIHTYIHVMVPMSWWIALV
jgi:hypothetical protein